MSGPFRELFIEVPTALLEAAVIEAQQRVGAPIGCPYHIAKLDSAHPDVWIRVFKTVERNWSLIGWYRSSHDHYVRVKVRLPCGHAGYFHIDEHVLLAHAPNVADLANYIFDKIDEGPIQRCKCGEPQGLGPAGRSR